MISVSSEWFEVIGAYRGVMPNTDIRASSSRLAELYALAGMLRVRTITLQGGAEG